MKQRSDERLEQLLTAYCKAAPEQSFVYDPNAKKERTIPFVRVNRIAALAASLVLVSVLSLVVYFSFGNKAPTPIAVAPSSPSTAPSEQRRGSGDPGADQMPSGSVSATESKSGLQKLIELFFADPDDTLNNSPSESPAAPSELNARRRSSASPTQPATSFEQQQAPSQYTSAAQPTERSSATLPTEAPQEPTQNKPATQPTQPSAAPQIISPTECHTDPTQEGHEPTSTATQPPVPTNAPQPTDPRDPPCNDPTEGGTPATWEPTDPPGGYDGEPGVQTPAPVELYGTFAVSRLPADRAVFCKVYDSRGNLLGDKALYSSEHRAVIERATDTTVFVVYTTPEEMIYTSGYYNYIFYDRNGKLLAQCQDYIDLN